MLTEHDLHHRLQQRLHDELAPFEPSPALLRALRTHRPRRRRPPVAAAAAVTAALGLAGGLLAAHQPTRSPAGGERGTVQLMGRRVHLPAGFRLVSAVSDSACSSWLHTNVGFAYSAPDLVDNAASAGHMLAGSTGALTLAASGGAPACLQTSVSVPYHLPPGVGPTTPFVAPGTGQHLSAPPTPTTVDGSYAEVIPVTATALRPVHTIVTGPSGAAGSGSGSGASSSGSGNGNGTSGSASASGSDGMPSRTISLSSTGATMSGVLLCVRIPDGGGRFQLVVVLAWAMPQATVLQLADQALAGGPPPVSSATAYPLPLP